MNFVAPLVWKETLGFTVFGKTWKSKCIILNRSINSNLKNFFKKHKHEIISPYNSQKLTWVNSVIWSPLTLVKILDTSTISVAPLKIPLFEYRLTPSAALLHS